MKTWDDLAERFVHSTDYFLKIVQPQFNKYSKLQMAEKHLQAFYVMWLKGVFNEKVKESPKYPGSGLEADISFNLNQIKTVIEIEWSGRWTDGFQTKTFDDLLKLEKHSDPGTYCMFFAINISDKYKDFPENMQVYIDPNELPIRNPKQTALINYWNNEKKSKPTGLLYSNPRFWLWKYKRSKDKNKYNVLVFTCHGRKSRSGGFS